MRTQIRQNPTKEIEEFIRMLFLDVCKLLSSSVSYELSAAFFEEAAKFGELAWPMNVERVKGGTHVTSRSSLALALALAHTKKKRPDPRTLKMPSYY